MARHELIPYRNEDEGCRMPLQACAGRFYANMAPTKLEMSENRQIGIGHTQTLPAVATQMCWLRFAIKLARADLQRHPAAFSFISMEYQPVASGHGRGHGRGDPHGHKSMALC